jgi:protein arginine kinase
MKVVFQPEGSASSHFPAWAQEDGATANAEPAPEADIVLSTRARIARNLADSPFPHCAADDDLQSIAARIRSVLKHASDEPLHTLRAVEVSSLDEARRAALVDSHLISIGHALAGMHRLALVDHKHTVSVLVNEEDHVRIQVILPGLQTDEAWENANRLDDCLSSQLPFAYHEQYGYLTASLANCGTGLRVSLMVHLPALALLGKLPATWQGAEALGSIVRGLYGEGAEPAGNVYQISNASSLGLTESQIVGRIQAVATYLLAEERAAREVFATRRRDEAIEAVERARDDLKIAERLSISDGMAILSTLRLGYLLGCETHVTAPVFNQLTASLRAGAGLLARADQRARDVFYEDTRRPAVFRNRIRQEKGASERSVSS